MKRATREWIKKAESDWKGTARLMRGNEPLRDLVCFHCQQTAEKYLKALLEELGVTIPKTHDLEKLLGLLLPYHPQLRSHRRGMGPLTDFAVVSRYPGGHTSNRQAQAALRWAGRVRETC